MNVEISQFKDAVKNKDAVKLKTLVVENINQISINDFGNLLLLDFKPISQDADAFIKRIIGTSQTKTNGKSAEVKINDKFSHSLDLALGLEQRTEVDKKICADVFFGTSSSHLTHTVNGQVVEDRDILNEIVREVCVDFYQSSASTEL